MLETVFLDGILIIGYIFRKLQDDGHTVVLENAITLGNFEANRVFEVMEVESSARGSDELVGIITARTVKKDGKEFNGKIVVPGRIYEEIAESCPCVCVHFGKVVSSAGREFHDFRKIPSKGDVDLPAQAARLRSLGEASLQSQVKIESLSKFPVGGIFACWGMETIKIGSGKVPVVNYEIGARDGCALPLKGRVFMPSRTLHALKGGCGYVARYNGEKTSKNGRVYHDVEIVSHEEDLTVNLTSAEAKA